MTKSIREHSKSRKAEFFYKKAKKVKVRARSYFKLQAIDSKFNIIKKNTYILDLGCAPGAWIQYVDSKSEEAEILGIDLLRVNQQNEFGDNVEIIQGDFNEVLKDHHDVFDLILSDMAPEFSGNAKMDRGRTHALNLSTIDFSKDLLKKKGDLVIKTFEGEDLNTVRASMKKMFKKVYDFKPQSSKKGSAEFYLVGIAKK